MKEMLFLKFALDGSQNLKTFFKDKIQIDF